MKEAGMAAQLAAVTLGGDSDQFNRWLNDPQKLLEMIAAAQGSKGSGAHGSAIGLTSGPAGGGVSAGGGPSQTESPGGLSPGAGPGPGPGRGSPPPSETEMYRILTALTRFGQISATRGPVTSGTG